jgi:hypothetical protein
MNTKMKVLSLAIVAAAGFSFACAAAAVCPSSPVPPWTAVNQFQGGTAAIVTGGYATTECRLDAAFDASAGDFSTAQVEDDSPATETEYRAAFIINTDNLASPGFTTTASVFTASSDATGNGVNLSIFGDGTNWFVGYFVADAAEPSGFFAGSSQLAAGENHVEFDLKVGASGSFSFWVNNNDPNNATLPAHTVNNSAVVGIDTAYLGLSAPSADYRANYVGQAVGFDQFDSRRTTFIGF